MWQSRILTAAVVLSMSFLVFSLRAQDVITTVAGTGTSTGAIDGEGGNPSDDLGDGGPAISASLDDPTGVAVAMSGSIYIADSDNDRIRKVSPTGIITTVAGNGIGDFSGDGGPATAASLDFPETVAVDRDGTLYIVDNGNNRIRKVSPDGIINTVAGNGTCTGCIDGEGGDPSDDLGDGGPATVAALNNPRGVAVDAAGTVYIVDARNDRIRKVDAEGVISTAAGSGTCTGCIDGEGGDSNDDLGDGGPAAVATLNDPRGLAVDTAGNLYIADTDNHRVRKVSPDGMITTVAGSGLEGSSGDGGLAVAASLSYPDGVTVDAIGNLYVASTNNHVIRKVSTEGIITAVAGGGMDFPGDGGPATDARLEAAEDVVVDAAGNLYIADRDSHVIRKVTFNVIQPSFSADGLVNAARFVAGDVAEQEIVSLFGLALAEFSESAVLPLGVELGGASVDITDSLGVTRPCLMFAALVETEERPFAQLNFMIPAGTATGPGTLAVRLTGGASRSIPINVAKVAPGIFTANGTGSGVPAANALRFVDGQMTEVSFVFDTTEFPFPPKPIDLGPADHQVFLSLFLTGVRNGSGVQVTIDGVPMTTIFGPAASSEFEGLDQLNVLLDRVLIGRGLVDVVVTVDGIVANIVEISLL